MNKLSKITYPIQKIEAREYPLLDELVIGTPMRQLRQEIDPDSQRKFITAFALVHMGKLQSIFDRARESGQLEPLASLAYSLIPLNVSVITPELSAFLLPYQQHVEAVFRDLGEDIKLKVQITPDNTWGEIILNNGILLLKSGGNYVAYRYSVQRGTNQVTFEVLPNLKSDLETTVRQYHNPQGIESPVLIKSTKPHKVKEGILPYFAYMLTGLKR